MNNNDRNDEMRLLIAAFSFYLRHCERLHKNRDNLSQESIWTTESHLFAPPHDALALH